ncbi:MAG: flagellar basal body rod protein FlgB [Nitrospiria bacterium]
MEIFNKTIDLLEKSLDIRSEKNRVIASNIANQDTPGYRAKEINFKDSINAASAPSSLTLLKTSSSHLGGMLGGSPDLSVTEIPGASKQLDGNTVNNEMEMAKLAENQINYSASIQFISEKFKLINYAITEAK